MPKTLNITTHTDTKEEAEQLLKFLCFRRRKDTYYRKRNEISAVANHSYIHDKAIIVPEGVQFTYSYKTS